MGVRDINVLSGVAPPAPKPTDLDKDMKEAPPHPMNFDLVQNRHDYHYTDDDVRAAAQKYFSYMLMIGADEAKLKKDPYWKYMEV